MKNKLCSLCNGTGKTLTMYCMPCGGVGCFHCGYKGAYYATCISCNGKGSAYEIDTNKSPQKTNPLSWIILAIFGFLFLEILSEKPKNNNPLPQPNPVNQEKPAPVPNSPIPETEKNTTKAPSNPEDQKPISGFSKPSNTFSLWGENFTQPADKAPPSPTPKMLRVVPLEANIRLEPDPKSLSLDTIPQGALVTILGSAQNSESGKQWFRVQTQSGIIGFIRSKLLEDPEESPAPSSDLPDEMIVIAQEANIRSEPDPNSPSLGTLPEGAYVTVLGYAKNAKTGKEWKKVETEDGLIGFIRSTLLRDPDN
jgi:hypothetical protein